MQFSEAQKCLQAKQATFSKMCCRTKKNAFQTIFFICKIKLCTFKQFFLFCNLLSKLKLNCFKVHKLILQIAKTCPKSNYFVRQHMIYLNVASFARKHFWASEHYISVYSKPVWTPCNGSLQKKESKES